MLHFLTEQETFSNVGFCLCVFVSGGGGGGNQQLQRDDGGLASV